VAGAVVGAFVGMSRRPVVQEKMNISCSGRSEFDAMGAGNILLDVGRFIEGKGLVLSIGSPLKVTMVMMTL